jgi:hypothetical protein
MFLLKPLGYLSAAIVIIACFMPWVIIESHDLTLTGFRTTGTAYGKPGLLHVVFTVIYLLLLVLGKVWSRRLNLLFATFNFAWAIRNFTLVSTCSGGDCPSKQAGLYLLLASSLVMLIVVLFAPEKRVQPED